MTAIFEDTQNKKCENCPMKSVCAFAEDGECPMEEIGPINGF